MENVIKQGYLKKGNSAEGGMFSGIFDKMAPRKWYMLVVRNRIPYLEQYERDVDVFSSDPCEAYNLSVCTSICRTMSTSARTFTFVIVCPNQLIELIAASREQMRDWCDALERTLNCLGFLKKDREEHIYTFCPVASNVLGHSQKKTDEEETGDEELGAVGGAPAPPPPARPSQPLSGSISRSNSLDSSSAPQDNLTPLVVPSSPGLRSKSPSNTRTPSPLSGRPPPVPTLPPPPLPSHSSSSSCAAPPLPQRPSGSSSSLSGVPIAQTPPVPTARPLPSIPGANQQEKSLPSEPVESSESSKKIQDSSDNSDTDDSSSDFVSGAFWEINRKTPVPSARHAQLPLRPAVLRTASGSPATAGAEGSDGTVEELDEGYPDLATWTDLKTQHTVGPDGDVYTKVTKPVTSSGVENQEASNQKEDKGQPGGGSGGGPVVGTCVVPVLDAKEDSKNSDGRTAGSASSQSFSRVVSENSTLPEAGQALTDPQENCYSVFPVNDYDNAPARTVSENQEARDSPTSNVGCNKNLPDVITMPKAVSNANHHSSPHLPGDDLETDNVYASAAEASSIPVNTVPPLPERQDSLPSWRGEVADGVPPSSADSTAAAASNGSSVSSGASLAEGVSVRPLPARRRTIHPVSSAATQQSFTNIPPLPPRKTASGSMIDSVKGLDSAHPPPLPARKAQSFRFQRPMSTSQLAGERGVGEEGGKVGPVHRQMSFGGSDVTENHLRMRMRLDNEHSVHSVVSLKQSQAEILRQEMELPGVTVTTSVRAAQGIGVVDCADAVCIVGWNQKDFPSLHGKFHIGDQLISICNVKVTSASMAQKMMKHPATDLVEMLVKRIPYGCVLAIRRSMEGQSIGIKRNGGTAEIQYVDPHGLAATNGLASHANAILPGGVRSHWMLTEINSRPLNLFFKDNEIEHRLNAVGREITLVVQPADYIGELKKQLKKLRNHKSFIVQ